MACYGGNVFSVTKNGDSFSRAPLFFREITTFGLNRVGREKRISLGARNDAFVALLAFLDLGVLRRKGKRRGSVGARARGRES
jgi:hypothetical protein